MQGLDFQFFFTLQQFDLAKNFRQTKVFTGQWSVHTSLKRWFRFLCLDFAETKPEVNPVFLASDWLPALLSSAALSQSLVRSSPLCTWAVFTHSPALRPLRVSSDSHSFASRSVQLSLCHEDDLRGPFQRWVFPHVPVRLKNTLNAFCPGGGC